MATSRLHHQPEAGFTELSDAQRADRLDLASKLIDEVLRSLELRRTDCPHCERPTYVNWRDHNMAEPLRAMTEKLGRLVGGFRAPKKDAPG